MSRPCSVCRHPQRAEISLALVSGTSYRTVADRFRGLSKTSLLRHRPHVGAGLVKTAAAIVKDAARHDAEVREYDEASTLIEQIQDLQRRTLRLLDDAEQDRDGRLRGFAISQVRENIKLFGELMPASETTPAVEVRFSFPDSGAESRSEQIARETGQRRAVAGRTTNGPDPAIPENVEAAQGDVERVEERRAEVVAASEKPRVSAPEPAPSPFQMLGPLAPGGRTR